MANRPVYPKAKSELNNFKMEVAKDMGLQNKIQQDNKKNKEYMGNKASKTVGKMATAGNLGGEMVKRMIEEEEKKMI